MLFARIYIQDTAVVMICGHLLSAYQGLLELQLNWTTAGLFRTTRI